MSEELERNVIYDQEIPDTWINRRLMYARLSMEFGGSPAEWMKLPEKHVQFYNEYRNARVRRRKMEEEMNKAKGY